MHSTYRMYDREHGCELSDVLELHFIELSKFRHDKPQELQTRFERWLHLLKFSELYKAPAEPLPEELAKEEGIAMVVQKMRQICASDQVRELVEAREKAGHDWATRMEAARLDGEKTGREQGLEQGRERLLEAARRMLDDGMPAETVARLTGLSLEEFQARPALRPG